ncbi:unnamed protein product [Rotaria sp. Silwood2]|nr:unnamed protein product [Rotaria sp. Silwood2]
MSVEAGQHRIIGSIDDVGNIYSSLTITSEAFVSVIVPLTCSIYGGAILTIIGHGFSSNISQIQITIGSNVCPVVQAMDSQVQCIIPSRGNSSDAATILIVSHQVSFPSSFTLSYNETITPNITSVSPTFGNRSQVLVITGDNFVGNGQTSVTVGNTACIVSNYSIGSIACTVGLNLSAGHHVVTVHVDEIGNSNSDVFYTHDLFVTSATPSEGGYGGGLPVTILGYGFNGTDVTVNICNQSCSSVQIVSNVQLICVTPEVSMVEVNSSCNLTVTVNGISKNTLFTYKANLTAIVTSVSPTRGGTGGGTRITINGNNFPASANAVTVTIAESSCSLQTVTTTSITCETGSYQYSSVRAQVKVFVNGNGYAISSVDFQYIDLWSSPWTWGGNEPPEAGTLVIIENYVTIYLDIETPILKVLVIDNSTLIFDDSQDVTLNVEYIVIVNGGHLQVGTESNPFQHRGIITMYGHLRSIELPIFGAKVLALREGTVDMHGMPTVRTWTQLGATAGNGSTTITLLQPIDWNVDSQIVIATTGDRFSQKESEIRRIVNISSDGLTLILDTPLMYTHLGVTQTLNSTNIEVRGEVGLLSHNVVFQGSITETWNEIIEECPAGFNPVAGITHYGYWYRLSNKTEGLSVLTNPNYCPNRHPFGRFYNNSVHSTGRFGVWIYPEYAPTISGDCNDTQPSQAILEGLVSWKNNKGIELVMTRTTQIKNAVVFDNADIGIAYITAVGHQETNPPCLRATFYDTDNGSSVIDSIIIGDAGISSTPIIPSTAGLVGWLTKFSNMSFINVSIRGKFRWEYDALYHDEDGTLGGQSDSIIMAPDGITNSSSTCTQVPNFENAIQCPLSEGSWLRFSLRDLRGWNQVQNPSTANTSIDIEISFRVYVCPCYNCGCPTTTTTTATTATTTTETTATTTSATTTTATTATTTTETTATTTTETTATTTTATTTTSTVYLPPIQPVDELPSNPQLGGNHIIYIDSIFINGGRLIAGKYLSAEKMLLIFCEFLIGLPNAPFNGSVDIILRNTGPVTMQLPWNFPLIEPRTIGVLGGLDLHGVPRGISWTRLAVTAMSGQNVIILREPVSWVVNDEIIITTTDTSISHTERHRIINIENATVIHTQVPLAYSHLVIQHTLGNGQTINVAAAVGLLTRNIRVINQYLGSSLSGFRILITDYRTDVLHIYSNTMYNAYYKGYARLSNTQFIGFGQLADGYYSEQLSGIYINRLGDYNPNRATFIDACSFDGGFNAAIGMRSTNGIPITNNVIYNTYRSGIVVTGMNNIVQNNLVTTVYWVGTGQDPSTAQFSSNYDGAIMARDATSVRLQNNLVAGVERLAYRIPGESCGGQAIYIPPNIINEYSNNEAHSAMSGVNLWPEDCEDKINPNSINIRLSQIAIPGVSANSSSGNAGGRSGIVFPIISRNNYMPIRSWTGTGIYPCLDGLMLITNTTLAFFNNTCGRHDVAIQVSQSNNDGQFPIATSSMFVYNISEENLIFNGEPNLGVVNPSRCGGSQQHGIGDFRIPRIALTNLTGHRININLTHPYRGISRSNSCSLQSSWGMYICNSSADYRMLIIESMDSDTEKRRLSPVAIMSNSGYIDLINGPQDQSICNGYSCRKRISTFMVIVQSGQTYQIFLSSTPPRHTRFRLLNADSTIKCVLALHYDSLQQIDIYANTMYMPPTNRDLRAPGLMLLDQPNNVTLLSPSGSNYFDRTSQMAYIAIDGSTMIDIKVSPLLILSFGFPPMDPESFYSSNLVANLAALLNISPDKIRRVNIVSASNQTRIRRQASSVLLPIQLQIELRDEPRTSSIASTGIRAEILSNIASTIINRYQVGELQVAWRNLNVTNGSFPSVLSAQEPFDNSSVELSIINRLLLVSPPRDCRQQSPCTFQPVLVAYDVAGNVIQKLGSNERPWQVKATVVGRPNLILPGGIANYSDGQTQYILFSLPDIGTQQVQFTLIQPDGVNSSFLATTNLSVQAASVSVTQAVLAGEQVNNVYVANVNETFSIAVMPVDSVTRLRLGQIQWGSWRWSANVTLISLPKFNRHGSLVKNNSSRTNIDLVAGTVTITNLAINATGMYVLQIRLVASNNEHIIELPSNGILVKENNDNFITEIDAISSNFTFAGDFDALNASGELEIIRAMIYNYLINIGMPVISDIILVKGSVGAIVQIDSENTNIYTPVTSMLADPNAIPRLNLIMVNINGHSYSVSSSSSNDASSNDSASNTDNSNNNTLIIGLVVGLVGGLLLVIGVVWGYKARERILARHRLGVGETDEDRLTGIDENCVASPRLDALISVPNLQPVEFSRVATIPPAVNGMHSTQPSEQAELQSAACNLNLRDFNKAEQLLPSTAIELIAFD